jgi:hypothetical protein
MNANHTVNPSPVCSAATRLPRFVSVLECVMPARDGPCTQVACRYHLADRRLGEPQLEPTRDCALSVASEGPHTTEEVGRIAGLTRARVRQLEESAFKKLARSAALRRLHDEFK